MCGAFLSFSLVTLIFIDKPPNFQAVDLELAFWLLTTANGNNSNTCGARVSSLDGLCARSLARWLAESASQQANKLASVRTERIRMFG